MDKVTANVFREVGQQIASTMVMLRGTYGAYSIERFRGAILAAVDDFVDQEEEDRT